MKQNKFGTFDPNTNNGFLFFIFMIGVVIPAYWLPGVLKLLALFPFGWLAPRVFFKVLAAIKYRAEKDAVGEWNGRYFAFDGQRVRIYWDDKTTWLVADDVFAVLERDPDSIERRKIRIRVGAAAYRELPSIPGECFSEEGVMKYFASLREEETRKVRRWLEREVFANIRRIRELGTDNYRRFEVEQSP